MCTKLFAQLEANLTCINPMIGKFSFLRKENRLFYAQILQTSTPSGQILGIWPSLPGEWEIWPLLKWNEDFQLNVSSLTFSYDVWRSFMKQLL